MIFRLVYLFLLFSELTKDAEVKKNAEEFLKEINKKTRKA
jgi:hypothetical protein